MNASDISIKLKHSHNERLITAPSYDTITNLLESISDLNVTTYLSLCATTGICVERLFNLTWNDIDFDNGFVLKKIEHLRTKHYRPNPIHDDIGSLIAEIPVVWEQHLPLAQNHTWVWQSWANKGEIDEQNHNPIYFIHTSSSLNSYSNYITRCNHYTLQNNISVLQQ